jgi:hypothetical protein
MDDGQRDRQTNGWVGGGQMDDCPVPVQSPKDQKEWEVLPPTPPPRSPPSPPSSSPSALAGILLSWPRPHIPCNSPAPGSLRGHKSPPAHLWCPAEPEARGQAVGAAASQRQRELRALSGFSSSLPVCNDSDSPVLGSVVAPGAAARSTALPLCSPAPL